VHTNSAHRNHPKVKKNTRSVSNSPDGGDYPFVPGFGAEDNANQQENGAPINHCPSAS